MDHPASQHPRPPLARRPSWRPARRRAGARWVVAALLLVASTAACSSAQARDDAPDSAADAAWPGSLVVLGHSGINGEGTPGDPLDNSWASGSNPAVDSVYLRLVDRARQVEGHVTNLAQTGATVADVEQQVDQALDLDPAPGLVVVQVVDNDMACPATDADVTSFEQALAHLLGRLSSGLPGSRIFIPTFYATPESYIRSLSAADRRTVGGKGPCAIVAPDGSVNRVEIRRLDAIIGRYDDAILSACASVPRCWSDRRAFERTSLQHGDIGEDLSHLSIAGNAHAARVAWRALLASGIFRGTGR